MSKTITIEITTPPVGWVYDSVREARSGEYYFNNGMWVYCGVATIHKYPVAVQVKPKWTPPPEWAAIFGHCWMTRDCANDVRLHDRRPKHNGGFWTGSARFCIGSLVRPEMLPPDDIPPEESCWEIGG